ncbi:MAG: hypothetical protein AAGA29_05775 [Planctomycetota bacterium]
MTDAQLLTHFIGQSVACVVLVALILLVLASAAEQVVRYGISRRHKRRLNHPLTLRPTPLDDLSNSAA